MNAIDIRKKFIGFFSNHQHSTISGSSLIPENDPSVLFTTAGMHPLVPYLLGEPHPLGKCLANCQKCLRTDDIDIANAVIEQGLKVECNEMPLDEAEK